MQYQYSSAMASFCANSTLYDAMRQVKQAGFDSLDFPFSVYSVGFDAPLLRENWRDWVKEVKQTSQALQLPITQAHAAWLQDIPADLHYEAPWELYHRTIEACAMLGCKHLIFHPVRRIERVDSLAVKQRIHDWNVRWFHELVPVAEQFDVYLNLENTFDAHHVQKAGDPPYPYTTTEDMLALVRDLSSNRIRLCLDTGHANISAQNIPEMIRAFRGELATVHLNDNYGYIAPVYEDLHLFPGDGVIDWNAVFAALREIRFRGVMNIEPIAQLPRMSAEARIEQLQSARKTLAILLNDA